MRRTEKPCLCLADLITSAFDAAEDLGVPQLTAVAVTSALVRTQNLQALARLLELPAEGPSFSGTPL